MAQSKQSMKAWWDGKREARCRSCDAPIVWITTVRGKRMPVDVGTLRRGIQIIPHDGSYRAAQVVTMATPHWATCPNADQHRREREPGEEG